MKSFKETFNLIYNRLHILEGIITQSTYCIENNIHVDYNQRVLTNAKKEKEALKQQDNDLRNLIVDEQDSEMNELFKEAISNFPGTMKKLE